MEYTREQLIEICQKAFVPHDKWRNRDTADAVIGVGKCLALLKAGCHFDIQKETNDETIWIQFWIKDFSWFEGIDSDPRGNRNHDGYFYLPTLKRLEFKEGKDWY